MVQSRRSVRGVRRLSAVFVSFGHAVADALEDFDRRVITAKWRHDICAAHTVFDLKQCFLGDSNSFCTRLRPAAELLHAISNGLRNEHTRYFVVQKLCIAIAGKGEQAYEHWDIEVLG